MKKYLIILIVLFIFSYQSTYSQCTHNLPANTVIISADTTINCGLSPNIGKSILICPGATLTLKGNSTCFNKFYLESGASLILNDTAGIAPYGSFDFFLKTGSTLNFNKSCGYSGPIDSLYYESGAVMTDTGSSIMHQSVCTQIIFDYSLLPVGSNCSGTSVKNISENIIDVSVFPNPFINNVEFSVNEKTNRQYLLSIFDFSGKNIYSALVFSGEKISINKNNLPGVVFFWSLSANNQIFSKGILISE